MWERLGVSAVALLMETSEGLDVFDAEDQFEHGLRTLKEAWGRKVRYKVCLS